MGYIGNQPAETPVVEILETDFKIGEDDQPKIDFADANNINFHADNAKEMVLSANALTPGTSDGTALGTTSLMWSDIFLASGGVMNFNNGNVTITHTNGTGLTINSTNKLMFGDAASFIHQSTDGTLTIDGEAIIDLNASTRVDVSGDLKVGSNIELGNASDTTLARSAAGEVTIEGVAIKKVGLENIWVPATAMTPSETNGCASLTSVETSSGRPDLIVLDFDKSSDEFAHFSIAMPKSWNEGTITFQAYWTSASTDTGTVAWAMSGVSFGDNDLIDQDYGTTVVATAKAHSGTAEDLNISAVSGNLTVANAAADELAFFEIFRDVSADDHDADARLLGVKIFYTTDTSTDA